MSENGLSNKELLLEVRTDIRELRATLALMAQTLVALNTVAQDVPDHENRIRSLERFRYTIPGIAVVAGIVSIATFVISYL